MPVGASGGRVVYRKSMLEAIGYDGCRPTTTASSRWPKSCTPPARRCGLALGNAVGDGNAWCNWLIWAFGGRMVDDEDNLTIDSPETVRR